MKYDVTERVSPYTHEQDTIIRVNNHNDAIERLLNYVRDVCECDFRDYVHNGNEFDISVRFVLTNNDDDSLTMNAVLCDHDNNDSTYEIARFDVAQKNEKNT